MIGHIFTAIKFLTPWRWATGVYYTYMRIVNWTVTQSKIQVRRVYQWFSMDA